MDRWRSGSGWRWRPSFRSFVRGAWWRYIIWISSSGHGTVCGVTPTIQFLRLDSVIAFNSTIRLLAMVEVNIRKEVMVLSAVIILAGVLNAALAAFAMHEEHKATRSTILLLIAAAIGLVCGLSALFAVFKEHIGITKTLWLVSLANTVITAVFVGFVHTVFSVVSLVFSCYYTYALWTFKQELMTHRFTSPCHPLTTLPNQVCSRIRVVIC